MFASERLTSAWLDHLTHHIHILEMNGDNYRLKQSASGGQRGTRFANTPDNSTEGWSQVPGQKPEPPPPPRQPLEGHPAPSGSGTYLPTRIW